MKGIRFSSLLLITLLFSVTAYATDISYVLGPGTLNGYNTTTAGSYAEPWTINETFTGTSTLILKFGPVSSGSALGPGNTTGTSHYYGKWIEKTVYNGTNVVWNSFEIEVQLEQGVPSPQLDGISFADGSSIISAFESDKFDTYTRIDTSKDYLNFHEGTVNPGESVKFLFAITDNSIHNTFYLAETPNKSDVPEPATLLLFSTGLAGIGLAAWRRKKKSFLRN